MEQIKLSGGEKTNISFLVDEMQHFIREPGK